MSFSAPFPPEMKVVDARDGYLQTNGFPLEDYDAPFTDATFFFIPIKVPNTKAHRSAIRTHDLHHVATGYGTNLVGEAEISLFEWRRSGTIIANLPWCDFYVSAIVRSIALFGIVFAPIRAFRALRAAAPNAGQQRTLFPETSDESYEALLQGTVGDLRARLGLPVEGLAKGPQKLHPRAPKSL